MKRVAVWLGGIALTLAGCGGSAESDGAQCSNVAGCGGDVVGTWSVKSTCLTPSMPSMSSCKGMTTDASGVQTTGTVTFKTDNTFTSSIAQMGSVVVTLPASCLMARNGVTITCSQLEQSLQGAATNPSSSSISCGAANGGCACKVAVEPQSTSNSGSYATSGSVLTEIRSDGSSQDNAYCVDGDTLTLSPTSSPAATGRITLTKG